MITVKARPPKEARQFWESRVPVTADDFAKLTEQARQRAFVVSGLARQELVDELHASILHAYEEGLSIGEWRKRARALLSADGDTPAALLKRHRLDTIFRTNLQTGYQAGRYAQMMETVEDRPIWRISAVLDRSTRPGHAAVHGKCYPANHEFWTQFFPPNGFNCRCTVSTLTAEQAERRGYTVESELPGPVEVINKKTGEVHRVLPAPDPGFGRNVGKDWLAGLEPTPLEERITPLPTPTLCKNGKGMFADDACLIPLEKIGPRHILQVAEADILPQGLDPEQYVEAFLRKFEITDIGGSKLVELPGVKLPLVVSREMFIDKRTREWKVLKNGRERYVHLLAEAARNPYEVWFVPAQVSGRPVTVLRLIRLFASGKNVIGGFSVFNLVKGGHFWQGTTAFTPNVGAADLMYAYLEKQRQGSLLYREP